jgi:dTDP-4-dehydrorhamnose reductase
VTWCGFAREIFNQWQALGYAVPEVKAITTADYPTPAKRPANSVMAGAKLARDYAIKPRPWRDALSDVLSELAPETKKKSEETR